MKEEEIKPIKYIALHENEVMYIYSDQEAKHYFDQRWVVLKWKPILNIETQLVFYTD